MTLIRKVARPLLGASFIAGGVDRLRRPQEAGEELQAILDDIASVLPQAESAAANPKLAAQVLGGVQVGAGVMLAAGKFPRLAALALCGAHKINSYAEYRSASTQTEAEVTAQRKSLLKNISILGGLWLATVDNAGKPSLAWRAEHISKNAQKKGAQFGDKTKKWAENLGDDATGTLKAFEKEAKNSFRKAEQQAKKAASRAAKEAQKVTS